MSNELLEKVIDTTNIGAASGGILNPAQSNRFIDYIWDATALGADARTIRMNAPIMDIDKVAVGQRILRAATEATDTGVNTGATFTKISLTTTKVRLDWELSTESLEDNIEGVDLEDHIARMMATQIGNDVEDLSINGDTGSSDLTLQIFDGWRKRVRAGAHVVDAAGEPLTTATFNTALKALPRKYKQRRKELRFYAGSNLIQDYLYALRQGGVQTPDSVTEGLINGVGQISGAGGGSYPFAFGIPVLEVPLYEEAQTGSYSGPSGLHGDLDLTFPKNRIWGIKREIQVFREFKAKKDTIEYTVFSRIGVQIENLDAWVHVRNNKVVGT